MNNRSNMSPHDSFSDNVSDLITDSEKTLREIAKDTGIPASSLSGYQNRHGSDPRLSTIVALSEYFGVSTDYLLGRTTVKSSNTTVRDICDYTGLNEKAVEILHKSRTGLKYSSFEMPELNALLCDPAFWSILELLSIYRVQCQAAASRPIMIENSTNEDDISRYKKDLRRAKEDKDLCIFRIQKLLFAIAQEIETTYDGGGKNAINKEKGNEGR